MAETDNILITTRQMLESLELTLYSLAQTQSLPDFLLSEVRTLKRP